MNKHIKPVGEAVKTERLDPSESDYIKVGDWFWSESESTKEPVLMCAMKVGTNFVELNSPHSKSGYRTARIHLNEVHEKLTREPNASQIIALEVSTLKTTLDRTLEEVRELTHQLGLPDNSRIGTNKSEPTGESREIAMINGASDVNDHKQRLAEAREKTLPDLFKKIEETNEQMASWMKAETMPFLSEAEGLKDHLKNIDDRIFNISLYAGLLETIEQCRDGKPADVNSKLRVMQRRLYMDEECLANYSAGGMEFGDIEQFDQWLAQDENMDRILPFDRCIVAMQVRRKRKERSRAGNLLSLFIQMNLDRQDKLTFLYIRNGERLYRLNTDVDFGEKLFPGKDEFDPSEPLMMEMFGSRVKGFMPVREYDAIQDKYKAERAKWEQWFEDNPLEQWLKDHEDEIRPGASESHLENQWRFANPMPRPSIRSGMDQWERFDQDSVYYDDGVMMMLDKMREYNRIALIIQGLLDRTDALAPHHKIRTWLPEEFAAHIELVYDADNILFNGDEPDIEAYIERCNETLGKDSVVVGQQLYWMEVEADKENQKRGRDFRSHELSDLTYYRPYGNPGPGDIARVASWSAGRRKAKFQWFRQRMNFSSYDDSDVAATVTVPADRLLNIDAYRAGDYKRFFADHRTRAKYLQWAPLLLAAEDYLAGKAKVVEPGTPVDLREETSGVIYT